MDDRLKQRLVGAIVLVALAVIFIPMVLDGGDSRTLPPFGQVIPEKPAVLKKLESTAPKPVVIPPPPAMVERELVDKHTPILKSDATAPTSTAVETKKPEDKNSQTLRAKKGIKAWVVQVGSFENRKNAQALNDKLRRKKYRAFVEAVKTNGRWNYRVQVGPEVRRSSAEATQKTLQTKLKINGVVMGHP